MEEHVAQAAVLRQEPHDALRQARSGLVAEVPEGGVVGELSHLGGHRLGDLRAPVTHVDVEQPREAVDHAAAVGEREIHAPAAREEARSLLLVLLEFVDGMDQMSPVERLNFL
jgi:hypothetical protein